MSWYTTAKKAPPKDYGWVSVPLPKDISKQTVAYANKIPEYKLFIKKEKMGEIVHGDGWKYGIEDDPHITVKWGIETKSISKVKEALDDLSGGDVTFGVIDFFSSDDEYDVVKINITSPALRKINKALSDGLATKDSFSIYRPHVTLAYVKKGIGKEYKSRKTFDGVSFSFDKVVFEDSVDKKTTITLEK